MPADHEAQSKVKEKAAAGVKAKPHPKDWTAILKREWERAARVHDRERQELSEHAKGSSV